MKKGESTSELTVLDGMFASSELLRHCKEVIKVERSLQLLKTMTLAVLPCSRERKKHIPSLTRHCRVDASPKLP